MNRLITLLLIVFATLNYGTAQEVPEQQQTLLTKVTATWCPNCGTWGWTFYEDIYEDNNEKALLIKNHYSGDLANPTAEDFATNFNISYQPKFLVGNVNQEVSSGNAATKRTSIKNQVDAAWETSPVVNAGLEITLDGNTLIANTKTRFFQETSGEFYVGVYVIEDGIINNQSGQSQPAIHNDVLRASMSSSSFGELIASGSIAMGSEFDQQFSMDLDPGWNIDNLTFATIVWEKDNDGTYLFTNTHYTSTIGNPVSTGSIENQDFTMKVFPSLITGNATVELNLAEGQTSTQLTLMDISGKTLETVFSGDLPAGRQTFEINRSMVTTGGLYFLVLQTSAETLTRKVVFQ